MSDELITHGSDARKQRRDAEEYDLIERVRPKFEQLRREHFARLEDESVPASEAHSLIDGFIGVLAQKFSDINELRVARNLLIEYISAGNASGSWEYSVPPAIQRRYRTAPTRTKRSLSHGVRASRVYQLWYERILGESALPSYRSGSARDCLADVVLSAVFHGGLHQKKAVVAFARLLCEEGKPIFRHKDLAWVDLIWSEKKSAVNYRSKAGDWQVLRRFYLDDFTLSFLTKLRCRSDLHTLTDIHEKTLIDMIYSRIRSLESCSPPDSVVYGLKSLSVICQGATVVTEMLKNVELSEALLQYANGKVFSASMRPEHHEYWLTGKAKFPIEESTEIHFSQFEKFSCEKQSGVSNATHPLSPILSKVHKTLTSSKANRKVSIKEAGKSLDQLSLGTTNIALLTLIGWLRSSLVRLQVSSADRYFSEIGPAWLQTMYDLDVPSLDDAEREELYEEILHYKRDKEFSYRVGRLKSLHKYLCQQYDLPMMSEFFTSYSGHGTQTRVRPGVISEPVFEKILLQLSRVNGLSAHELEGLRLMITLSYRIGFRRGELAKIRSCEVATAHGWHIEVCNNRYGNNKTASAKRRVSVRYLLKPEEFESYQAYVKHRVSLYGNAPMVLLFSRDSAENVPWDADAISRLFKYLLVAQGVHGMSFHHLRHSALSRLALALDSDYNGSSVHQLSGYSDDQAKFIREYFIAGKSTQLRDKFWVLADIAGHLSPGMTFSNYIHHTDLLVYERVRQFQPEISARSANLMTGLDVPLRDMFASSDNQRVKPAELRPIVLNRLSKHVNDLSIRSEDRDTSMSTSGSDDGHQEIFNAGRPRRSTLDDCYCALKALESGSIPLEVSVQMDIPIEQVESWLANAQLLQTYKTKHGCLRLFSKLRTKNAVGLPLTPPQPTEISERLLLSGRIGALRRVYRDDPVGLSWVLHYWLNHVITSKSSIRFNTESALIKYINILSSVIPKKSWLVVVCSCNEDENIHQEIRSLSHDFRKINRGSRYFQLALKHPDYMKIIKERGGKYKQYSSSSLRYIFHMLIVMIGHEKIARENDCLD